jgi:hypothetical protein
LGSIAGSLSGNGGTTGDGESIFDRIGDGLNAVGDFLGFDGDFGYQGPEGRNLSLAGLGNAIGDVIAPPAAATTEPVLAGYDAYDLSAYGSFNDAVYRPGEDDALLWLAQGGGARPGGRHGIGGNRPPPENTTLQPAFPGLPNSPAASAILGTVDELLGGAGANAAYAATDLNADYFLSLNRQLNPDYNFPDSLTAWRDTGLQGRNALIEQMRSDLGTATYNLQRDTVTFLQRRADIRYDQALSEYRAGRLPAGLSQEQAVGSRMDALMRGDLQALYRSRGVSFGPRQYVTVNSRQYAADGSYRIPDAQVGRVSMDWSLTAKTDSTPQVQGFFNARSSPVGVIIIRPTQVGGSYYIPRPVATSQRR